MRKTVAVILLVAICILSCEEDKVKVANAPPGTMIMKLNGVSLPPNDNYIGALPNVTGFAVIYADNSIRIWGEFQRVEKGTIVGRSEIIITLDIAEVGRLAIRGNCLSDKEPGNVYYNAEPSTTSPVYYSNWRVDEFVAGSISITKLDRSMKLVSGAFELRLKGVHSNEVIDLTEGSFTDLPLL